LTNDGDLLGSPQYMAPEQAANPKSADIRADLYGLGCVLYHALAGGPPFDDKSNVRLLVRHATETPRPLAEVRPDAPTALQAILDRLLAKDPAKRFQIPGAALEDLTSFAGSTTDEVVAEGPGFALTCNGSKNKLSTKRRRRLSSR
jgi:eukaryotic-like serine/threonine-protein kinase